MLLEEPLYLQLPLATIEPTNNLGLLEVQSDKPQQPKTQIYILARLHTKHVELEMDEVYNCVYKSRVTWD
jgi:hypothetical protein